MADRVLLDPCAGIRQSKPFPVCSLPTPVGCFSVDENRRYVPDATQLKYLRLPKVGLHEELQMNLNEGFANHRPKPDSAKQEKIDFLLTFIQQNAALLQHPLSGGRGKRRLKCEIVCFRGLLRLLACTPYEWNTSWIIQAIRYRDTIYLCERPTAERLAAERDATEQQKLFCYYGFKFEQYILADDPDREPDTSKPVVIAEEFCTMFDTTLAGKRLLYGAEMDGILAEEPIDKEQLTLANLRRLEFVEVKVRRRATNVRQLESFFRFKMRNWWCQSFFANVQTIVVGARDDNGLVQDINKLSLEQIERDSRRYWSASVCMNFCEEFLTQVTRVMQSVDSATLVYQFQYDPMVNHSVTYRVLDEGHPDAFLPPWYRKFMEE